MKLWVPVKAKLSDVAAGKFPETNDNTVTGYENYKEAMTHLDKPTYETMMLTIPNGTVGKGMVSGLYQVDIPEQDTQKIHKAFEGPQYTLSLTPEIVTDVQWAFPADYLNQEARASTEEHVFEGNVPLHLEAQQIASVREQGWDAFQQCIENSPPDKCRNVDAQDVSVARALSDAYGEQGFMNKQVDSPQSQYLQSYLRLMVNRSTIDTVAKCDQFSESFYKRLEEIESQNPEMSPMMAAERAMGATIQEFQSQADITHNLHEQRTFGEMAEVFTELSTVSRMTPEGDRAQLAEAFTQTVIRDGLDEETRARVCEQMHEITGDNLYSQIAQSNVNPEAWNANGYVNREDDSPDGPDETYYEGEDINKLAEWEGDVL
jgi:DNA-binding phage protein